MPELPEVEWWCRKLGQWTHGRTLRQISILDPRLFPNDPQELQPLLGQRINWVRRRAKWGLIGFEDHVLSFHLRMTGRWLKESEGQGSDRVRARLELDDGEGLLFDDVRRLGRMELWPISGWEHALEKRGLGPEPWPIMRDGAWWQQRLAGRRCAIKPALMRQDWVAGLGNIAGSEICFRAAIDPRRLASTLNPAEWDAIGRAVRDYIECTLAQTGALVYISRGGKNPFLVYGRTGNCPRCDGTITRFEQGGRGTWFCGGCQL